MTLLRNDKYTWLAPIWDALEDYRENNIPDYDPQYDEQWNEICTAMAWIAEELGVPDEELL